MKKIGWIGLGVMGVPMSKNIMKGGYSLNVYNRTETKTKELVEAGAIYKSSISELVSSSDIIIMMVTDDTATKEIFNSILGENIKDKLFINMSTIAPNTTKEVAKIVKAKEGYYFDAPVSGSLKPATDGTLVILTGGNKEKFKEVKPILDTMGKLTLYLGENGAGSTAKLCINYFLASTIQSLAETVLFAEKNGIPREMMTTIVNESACGSDITKIKSPTIIKDEYPQAFALKHMAKDVNLIKEEGMNYPLSEGMQKTYQEAIKAGLGELDVMGIIKQIEKDK